MPERLPRELRALYGLARAVSGGTGGPEGVLERLCVELREDLGFARAEVVPCEVEPARRAVREGRAVEEAGAVAVPVLVEGRPYACVVAGGRDGAVGESELHVLSALGLLAGVLVERAVSDERADRLKRDFLSTASHELRAPAAVVFGIAATLHLRGDALAPEQLADLRGALFEQSSRLRDLTEQLLDLSRIEAGTIVVRPQTFRPREWIDALLPRLAPDRYRDVVVDVPPELELRTDPDAFERVVGNLVANALRYGSPPVFVRGRGGETFQLTIEDRGSGVSAEFVPDLFGRFTRSDEASRPGQVGVGLGLSIARSFAEALGGTLHYEDAEPRGARFVLELPEALPLSTRAGAGELSRRGE